MSETKSKSKITTPTIAWIVPKVEQINISSFDEWYDTYREYIEDLYFLFKKQKRLLELDIFDKLDYSGFVNFVYHYSSKRIPRWSKEEKRRRYHLTDSDT